MKKVADKLLQGAVGIHAHLTTGLKIPKERSNSI
jgi:hypothetical protein